jgi:hypothetical protein
MDNDQTLETSIATDSGGACIRNPTSADRQTPLGREAISHLHRGPRIILMALGWDIEMSSVSKTALRLFYAHSKWKEERDKLTLRLKNP